MIKCYKLVDEGPSGSMPQIRLELYTFHPEVGPEGTPGRGPYCIFGRRVRRANVPEIKASLAIAGAIDFETATTTN